MNKILQWTIKLAGAAICMPVTWFVSGEVFANIGFPPLVFFMQIASLALVEGVFLSAWWMMDNDKQAPQEVKTRYVITVVVMYLMLWLLALSHNEGFAGIALRASLGLAIAGSVYESGVMTALKLNAAADRDINNDRKVKKIARELAKNDRIMELKLSSNLAQTEMRLRHDVEKTVIEKQITMDRNHRMADLKNLDNQFSENSARTVGNLNNGNPRLPARVARQRRKAKADERQDLIAGLLRDEPELSQKELAKRLKDLTQISGMTARTDVQKFYEAALTPLSHDGNGHHSS